MLNETLLRRGLRLEYITLAWNIVGAAVMLLAAFKAHSVAMVGFGLDSVVEIAASTVVVWELTGEGIERSKRALRLIGGAFFVLASYILIQSARAIYLHSRPAASPVGIVWLLLTFIAMVLLATEKGRVGGMLNNPVLLAESRVTMIDAFLAASVLIGLLFNATLGWWWADASAGLVIVAYGFVEARHVWLESMSR